MQVNHVFDFFYNLNVKQIRIRVLGRVEVRVFNLLFIRSRFLLALIAMLKLLFHIWDRTCCLA